jgi:two-component system NarL family response regulator/two-component system response regulator DegU
MPITILLVDDHKVFRDALKRTLEGCPDMLVVAEASDGVEAVELAERHRPDVALVDIGMKKMNGIEATVQLLRRSPETAVLILTVYNDEHYIASAAAAGARAYLTKDSLDEAELVQTIQAVRAGGRVFQSAAKSVGLHAAPLGPSGIRGG